MHPTIQLRGGQTRHRAVGSSRGREAAAQFHPSNKPTWDELLHIFYIKVAMSQNQLFPPPQNAAKHRTDQIQHPDDNAYVVQHTHCVNSTIISSSEANAGEG